MSYILKNRVPIIYFNFFFDEGPNFQTIYNDHIEFVAILPNWYNFLCYIIYIMLNKWDTVKDLTNDLSIHDVASSKWSTVPPYFTGDIHHKMTTNLKIKIWRKKKEDKNEKKILIKSSTSPVSLSRKKCNKVYKHTHTLSL